VTVSVERLNALIADAEARLSARDPLADEMFVLVYLNSRTPEEASGKITVCFGLDVSPDAVERRADCLRALGVRLRRLGE
jgi:hypothetical protein